MLNDFVPEDEDQYIVHPEFRLKRTSFDGINPTLGMSKHDRENTGDVLQNAPYVADMFQHHFFLEVCLQFLFIAFGCCCKFLINLEKQN